MHNFIIHCYISKQINYINVRICDKRTYIYETKNTNKQCYSVHELNVPIIKCFYEKCSTLNIVSISM
jgi:hypothetical protein